MYNAPGVRVRRRIRWARVFLVLLILFCILVAITGAAMYFYVNKISSVVPPNKVVTDNKTGDILSKRVNILLLGVDDGETEVPSVDVKRSDTMIVASINPTDGTINLLSIPRDTKVTIPGHTGFDKITHAYAYGGAKLAVQTVENFLHIPVNYYITVNWQGFINVIDILGGVNLYVEQNMDYEDPYANLKIHLQKGYQHLDGDKAGQYVRFRHDELGDIGRVQRQQRFLKALSSEMFQLGTVFKLPALLTTISEYVDSDMNLFTMVKLANSVKGFKEGNLRTEMLPGNFATIDGLSYWVHDKEQTRKLVEGMFSTAGNVRMSEKKDRNMNPIRAN